MYLKDIILKATTHINISKGNPQTKCGFHLQFADSATAQYNDTKVLSFVCGFHKLFWIRQIQLRIPQSRLFSSDFVRYNDLGICLWTPKQHRRSKKSSNVADSATNLILDCCGFRLKCRECTVWPRNVKKFIRENYDFDGRILTEQFK